MVDKELQGSTNPLTLHPHEAGPLNSNFLTRLKYSIVSLHL